VTLFHRLKRMKSQKKVKRQLRLVNLKDPFLVPIMVVVTLLTFAPATISTYRVKKRKKRRPLLRNTGTGNWLMKQSQYG
jgi:hypothetical protein